MGVEPGDPVVPDSPFLVMNGTKNYLGKGWDDRIGCAVLLEAMRRTASMPHANQLFYVATTQEEVGLRGARAEVRFANEPIEFATWPNRKQAAVEARSFGPSDFRNAPISIQRMFIWRERCVTKDNAD